MERRLLMIDDDIALGKLVQEFLTGEGWSCYWVDNGEEGYQEAVRVIGDGVPVVDKLHRDPVVKNNQQDGDDPVGKPVEPGRGAGWVGLGETGIRFLGN